METELIHTRPDAETVHALARALDCPPVLARLLVNRGIASEEAARFFWIPRLTA